MLQEKKGDMMDRKIGLYCDGEILKWYVSREQALADLHWKDPSCFGIYLSEDRKLYTIDEYRKK